MASKIMVVGDVHEHFDQLNVLIQRKQPDVVIVCGELGFWDLERLKELTHQKHTKIYACDGNHDDFNLLKSLMKGAEGVKKPIEVVKGVYYMPRGTILSINGQTLLFMGGAESIDKHLRKEGLDWFKDESITKEDVNALPECKVNIVISHTAPTFAVERLFEELCVNGQYDSPSSVFLDYVFDMYKPREWYFGHFHDARSIILNDCYFKGMNQMPDILSWRWLGE